MNLEARYGSRTIRFRLDRRPIKGLTIRVLPTGMVEVVSPEHAADAAVQARVAARGRWIVKQQAAFVAFFQKMSSLSLRNGESIRYLGRQYRLRIRLGDDESVRLTRSTLEVTLTLTSAEGRAAALVERWLGERGRVKISERFESCLELLKPLRLTVGGFTLRRMERRWGSCTAKGRILLNPVLLKVSADCIDYVIIHGLCHLRHHSHGPEFYRLLTHVLPDWRRRKAKLERCAG
jgi:predicted metal-dependent hydrolase